jgi:uncharacterized protein YecE (DUF72 family)
VDWLAQWRGDLMIAVEVRAKDLMTEAFARFLAERGIALVLVDRKGTLDLFDVWLDVGAVTRLAMIRWIGDDRNGPSGDRELSAPQDARLDEWAQRLVMLENAGMATFGYAHNPYEGHSPETVRRLLQRLGPRATVWPPPVGSAEGKEGTDSESADTGTEDDAPQMRLL